MAKNIHFLASSHEYVAPHYSAVLLDSLFRIIFAQDTVGLLESAQGPMTSIFTADTLALGESTCSLERIGGFFEAHAFDSVILLDSGEQETIILTADRIRLGDGGRLETMQQASDIATLEELADIYWGDYGRKWGMLEAKVPPYQEQQ